MDKKRPPAGGPGANALKCARGNREGMNRRPQRRRELEASGGQCQQLSSSSVSKLCKNTTSFKKIRFPDRIIMTVLFLSYGFWPIHPSFAPLFACLLTEKSGQADPSGCSLWFAA